MAKYQLRELETVPGDTPGTYYTNTSYLISEYEIKDDATSEQEKRAFLREIHKAGFKCKRGACRVVFDWDLTILEERKTGRPLFVALFLNEW